MSKETVQISVVLGKSQVPDGEKQEDQEEAVQLLDTPQMGGDVEGQAYYSGWTQCPRCGHIGWTSGLHTRYYVRVRCGRCDYRFYA